MLCVHAYLNLRRDAFGDRARRGWKRKGRMQWKKKNNNNKPIHLMTKMIAEETQTKPILAESSVRIVFF